MKLPRENWRSMVELEALKGGRPTDGVFRQTFFITPSRGKILAMYLARGGYYHQVALAHGIAKCTFLHMGHKNILNNRLNSLKSHVYIYT
jgi:hypothetical protein